MSDVRMRGGVFLVRGLPMFDYLCVLFWGVGSKRRPGRIVR
jgi:hypothetical protein